MAIFEKPLPCQCPHKFHATVLDTLPGNTRLLACLRCGACELVEAIVDEPRPHDVQLLGYSTIELAPEARAWATAWPRFLENQEPRVYFSAAARFETEADLAAAKPPQSATLRETLLALGVPPDHPPASLPNELYGFREIWHGLQLNDETPIDELLDAATRWNGPNQLAAEILARRFDLESYAAAYVANFSDRNRRYGRYLIRKFKFSGVGVIAALRGRLSELTDDKTGELSELCHTISALGPAAQPLRPELEAAAERVEDTDYYAHKYLTDLLGKLK